MNGKVEDRPRRRGAGPGASVPRPAHRRPATLALVAVGGLAGAPARAAVAAALPSSTSAFPTATFVTNLSGAFVLGMLLEALARRGAASSGGHGPGPAGAGRRRRARLLLGTGFCGAYTTYSTLAVDADQLVRVGRGGLAVLYAAGTVVAGLGCTAAGIALAAGHHRLASTMLADDADPDLEGPHGPGRAVP